MQYLPFDDFNRNLLIRFFVYRLIHCAEGTLAQDRLELVVLRISLAILQFTEISCNLFALKGKLWANRLPHFFFSNWCRWNVSNCRRIGTAFLLRLILA